MAGDSSPVKSLSGTAGAKEPFDLPSVKDSGSSPSTHLASIQKLIKTTGETGANLSHAERKELLAHLQQRQAGLKREIAICGIVSSDRERSLCERMNKIVVECTSSKSRVDPMARFSQIQRNVHEYEEIRDELIRSLEENYQKIGSLEVESNSLDYRIRVVKGRLLDPLQACEAPALSKLKSKNIELTEDQLAARGDVYDVPRIKMLREDLEWNIAKAISGDIEYSSGVNTLAILANRLFGMGTLDPQQQVVVWSNEMFQKCIDKEVASLPGNGASH